MSKGSVVAASYSTESLRDGYTQDDVQSAVLLYLECGNISEVARQLEIPRTTIQDWRKGELWDELIVTYRLAVSTKFINRFERVIDKGLTEQLDRLENGDWYIDKDGEKQRKPVNYRDITMGTAIANDKYRTALGQATTITSNTNQMDKVLEQLAEIGRLSKAKLVSEQ